MFRFSDDAEAVAMANDTEYGLAAYFFTRDLGRAWRVSMRPGRAGPGREGWRTD